MRKLFSLALIVVLSAFSLIVYAENDIRLETEYDGTGIWISGSTNLSKGSPIAIIVGKTGVLLQDIETTALNELSNAIEYVTVIESAEGGVIPRKYISLSENLPTGECKVFVRTIGGQLIEAVSFDHISSVNINMLLSSFNEMDYSEYEKIYTEKNKTTLSKLNAMIDVYDSLINKNDFYAHLIMYRPFTEDTVNNISAVYSLVNAFNKVCAFAELNEADDVTSVISKYNGRFWNIPIGENSVYMSLLPQHRETLMSNLKRKGPWDAETLGSIFQEEVAIAVFKSSKTRFDILNAIESYNSFYGLNMNLLNDARFNEYYISEVYNQILKGCSICSDVGDIVSLFESSVRDVLSTIKPNVKTSSGSGGGGGGYKISSNEKELENSSAERKSLFDDVPTTHWAYSYIDKLYRKRIVSGVSDTVFEPDRPVKREEFVKMLVSALGLVISSEKADIGFDDVPMEDYSYSYIKKAVEEKLIYGVDKKHFGFGRSIVREDVAVILSRILDSLNILPQGKGISYKDMNDISEYAVESVAKVTAYKLFTGNHDNYFLPRNSITRAEACVVIVRLMELIDIAEGSND